MQVSGFPVQLKPFTTATGVTVIVAIAIVSPIFVAVKAGILPVPLEASPKAVLLLIQE